MKILAGIMVAAVLGAVGIVGALAGGNSPDTYVGCSARVEFTEGGISGYAEGYVNWWTVIGAEEVELNGTYDTEYTGKVRIVNTGSTPFEFKNVQC